MKRPTGFDHDETFDDRPFGLGGEAAESGDAAELAGAAEAAETADVAGFAESTEFAEAETEELVPPGAETRGRDFLADVKEEAVSWFHPRKSSQYNSETRKKVGERARMIQKASSVWDRDRKSVAAHTAEGAASEAESDAIFAKKTARKTADVHESNRRVRQARKQLRHMRSQQRKSARQQRRRFARAKRQGRYRGWIFASAFAFLVAVVAVGVFTPVMDVRDIQVTGAEQVDVAAVTAALEPIKGEPIALVDDTQVFAALNQFDVIQRYAVEKVPPHTLIVRIQERQAVLAVQHDEHFRLYDAAGVLLGQVDERPAGVPLAEGQVRNPGSDVFQASAAVIRDMPAKLRQQVQEVTAESPQEVTLHLDSGVTVLWGAAEDSQLKAVVLERLTTALADKWVSRIDVSSSQAPVFE